MTTVEPKDGDADRPPGSAWLSSHGDTVSDVTEKENAEKRKMWTFEFLQAYLDIPITSIRQDLCE